MRLKQFKKKSEKRSLERRKSEQRKRELTKVSIAMPNNWEWGPNDIAPPPNVGGYDELLDRISFLWAHTKTGECVFVDLMLFWLKTRHDDYPPHYICSLYPTEFHDVMQSIFTIANVKENLPQSCIDKLIRFWHRFMKRTNRKRGDPDTGERSMKRRLSIWLLTHKMPRELVLGCGYKVQFEPVVEIV